MSYPSAFINPQTQVSSNVLSLANTPAQQFNIEAGFDVNGGLVVNMFPVTSGSPSPASSAISCIRYAGGQMTVFDTSGNPLPLVMPNSSIPIPSPLSFLGTNPVTSLIAGIQIPRAVSNLQAYARSTNGSLQYDANLNTATVTNTLSSSSNAVWSYAAAGTNMVVQSVKVTSNFSTATDVRTLAIANVNSFDNPTNDTARAATASTIASPPSPAATTTPTSVPLTATGTAYTANSSTITPANCNTNVYNFQGPQNMVFQHGLFSSHVIGHAWQTG